MYTKVMSMTSMSYDHQTYNCFSDAIGNNGLTQDVFENLLENTKPALEKLRSHYADKSLPILHLPERVDDLQHLYLLANQYREKFAHIVVLGIGGSSLGAKAICKLAKTNFAPRPEIPMMHFWDNIDPESISGMMQALPLEHTLFLVISKSGTTAETLAKFLVCLKAVSDVVDKNSLTEHFVAICEPGENILRRLAVKNHILVLDHDPDIGGRYSALSLVGLLPAMILGLEVEKVRAGAAKVLDPVLKGEEPRNIEAAIGAAISAGLAAQNIRSTVIMPYSDRLAALSLWYRQLWAESLGKEGKGTTPINALGTVDQHSQLQLYLDGPVDKMFTIIMLKCAGEGPCVEPALANEEALAFLSGKSVGDLMEAQQNGTTQVLIQNKRPTRIITLDKLDETSMGALMMHFMLETIITAHLFSVDPFSQPAVEEGKKLAWQYLADQEK
ncbi:MAG: glucose-6-phosphate isomerase [Rhodospirillaceae bacterium]|nr:glucose-6-phosphate isomerase [Rhodospirillaceae bacterium]